MNTLILAKIQVKIQDFAIKGFLAFFWHKFSSLVQFPSSYKISDQSDKMPRNENKNKISPVNYWDFHL